MDQLPDIIELDKLPPEKIQEARNNFFEDLLKVGTEKPVGFLPIFILKACKEDPRKMQRELTSRGLKTCIKINRVFGYEALLAYDEKVLSEILQKSSILLSDNGWPNEPKAFVDKLFNNSAPKNLEPLIQDVFADNKKEFPDHKKDWVSRKGQVTPKNIMYFLYSCAAGATLWFDKILSRKECNELASRLTMKDLILLARPWAIRERTTGQICRHAISQIDDELLLWEDQLIEGKMGKNLSGKSPVSVICLQPLLKLCRDYNPQGAFLLLKEENDYLFRHHHVSWEENAKMENDGFGKSKRYEKLAFSVEQTMLNDEQAATDSTSPPAWISKLKPKDDKSLTFFSLL